MLHTRSILDSTLLTLLVAALTACLGRTDDSDANGSNSVDSRPNAPSDTTAILAADFESFTLTTIPGYLPSLGAGCDAQHHLDTLTVDRAHGLTWDLCIHGGLLQGGTPNRASRILDDPEFERVLSDYARIHPVARPTETIIYDAPQWLLDVQTASGVSRYVAFDSGHHHLDRTPIDGDAYRALYERLYAAGDLER